VNYNKITLKLNYSLSQYGIDEAHKVN